jgi:hypothetical protein
MHPLGTRARELGAMQKPPELSMFLDFLEPHEFEAVVEIGTLSGGTLYCWCRLAEPDAVVFSIDLPGGPYGVPDFGGGCSPERLEEMRQLFPRDQQTLHLLRKDSHDRSTFEEVEGLLGEKQVDLLFIDGDHTYEGVKKDFVMYSRLVKSGGLIAFHDIMQPDDTPDPGVAALWRELKDGYRHQEFTAEPLVWGGIGVLWQQ